jgi:hypothetical protein
MPWKPFPDAGPDTIHTCIGGQYFHPPGEFSGVDSAGRFLARSNWRIPAQVFRTSPLGNTRVPSAMLAKRARDPEVTQRRCVDSSVARMRHSRLSRLKAAMARARVYAGTASARFGAGK